MTTVETTRDGAVLTITLNRPDRLNAFTQEMHRDIQAALAEAAEPEVRAVVVTGAGRGFCVGQDLTEFREVDDVAAHLRATYHRNVLAIRALEKPVIAAVNGAAAGAGLSLACACDIRIAADAATFVPAFVSIGLVPDSGGTCQWPQSGLRFMAVRRFSLYSWAAGEGNRGTEPPGAAAPPARRSPRAIVAS